MTCIGLNKKNCFLLLIYKPLRSNILFSKFEIFILLCALYLFVPFNIQAQDNYEIRKIHFKGNKTFKKADLLDHVVMHEMNFIKKLQKIESSLYSKEFIETDIQRLTAFYQSEGFLYAKVNLDSLDINNKKRKVNIYITIQENTPVVVDSIYFKINDPPPVMRANAQRRMQRRLDLTHGKRFTDQLLYSDVNKITTRFINRGYAYANTDFDLALLKDSTNISYTSTLGDICNFGQTTVQGNKYVKEKIIRRQLSYKADEMYRIDKLDKSRSNLYDLQLFRVVSLSPQMNRATMRNPIPITLTIEEMPKWSTKFGLGYGTEDKFRAFVDLTYRGLLGGSSRINLNAKHSALMPYYVSVSWIQPQFFLKGLSVSINPYVQRQKEPGYNTQTIGLKLPANYNFTPQIRTSLAYYFEKVTQHLDSFNVDIPNPENDKFLYSKSGLTGTFAWNTGAPVVSPVKGGSISVGAKLNGYLFGGDFSYTRLWVDLRKYQKLGDFVVSGRVMIGGIHSSDSSKFIPVEDRFYSGGGNSNRGWARSMLGPLRQDGTPLGGKSILEMNAEVRYNVFWEIDIAAFMDVSNIWEESYSYNFSKLNYAAGGGIRVNTPIGPVRVDVGVPIWNEKKSLQFFISIGQAF